MSNLARMHTAEHLLSAVMRKHFSAPRNLEFHLGEKKTKCDYEVPGPLSEDDSNKLSHLSCRIPRRASLPPRNFVD